MRGNFRRGLLGLCVCLLGCAAISAQTPGAPSPQPAAAPDASTVAGGRLHGLVKSGAVPLPGVTITAQNTLTGKRYSTTTDVTGAWSMTIPQNGRYVLRTQFAAFASGSQEAVLNAASHDQTVNFDLTLASRAMAQEQQQNAQETQMANAIRQIANAGPQSMSLLNALTGGETQAGSTQAASGTALPSIAGNSDFSGDSVAVSGQAGSVSPFAGMDMDRLRDAMESMRVQMGPGGPGGVLTLNGAGGGFGGGGMMFGGPGGFGGGPGGFRGNFRNFNPTQPHGAIFWQGSNSALNAQPFSLHGQPQEQPASGTNRFGVTLIGAPHIPGLTKPSGKDTVFLNISGSRNSSPLDQYAIVPTVDERAGNVRGVSNPIILVPQATALLNYVPLPNLSASSNNSYNYHLLTTQQSNSTQGGVRYMRGIGANATPFGFGGRGGGRRAQTTQGLRQSINANYNWSHSASDSVNIMPMLGGKTASDSNSLQAGYTLGYHKITSIFNANWNRSNAHTANFFTNGTDIATQIGVLGPNGSPLNASALNYGLPSIVLSSFTGITQTQPSFAVNQTISVSETLAWIHGKHNVRFGGEFRRVHHDFLGGNNATGTFYFTGAYTGSSLGDFLEGKPQETAINASSQKSYLRQNIFTLYAQDDWRVRSNLTLFYGLRYEFFKPYTEKYNRLSMVDTNPDGGFTSVTQVQAGQTSANFGHLPSSLVSPFPLGVAPRLGFALRLPKQTVVRGGYGMNYTVSEYSTFATAMAHQPPFANEQTNICQSATSCYSLANGFPAPNTIGNYAVDPHYQLPYVQAWNIDVQKTLRWGIMVNAGYNGSKGSNLDVKIAPRVTSSSPNTNPDNVPFYWEESGAFSRFNAGTLRVNKRLSNGLALGAYYTYSHSIDDAGSVGGTSSVVAQNWQDIAADAGNSSFDQRHRVSGTYIYELPFGKDKHWVTTGTASHLLEGLSISGSFTFASGTPLTPTYQASVLDVARGTTGTQRPDRVAGASLTTGGGSLKRWFNTDAFTSPTNVDGFGNAARNSIPGPGTVQNSMSLAKTFQLGDTRSMEIRATADNVFNTVQYSGVNTQLPSSTDKQVASTFGQVTSVSAMRSFQFNARFRF